MVGISSRWILGVLGVFAPTACGGHMASSGAGAAGTGGGTTTTTTAGGSSLPSGGDTAGLPSGGSGDSGGSGGSGGSTSKTSGSPQDLSQPWRSSGCGLPLPAEQVPTIPGSRTGYTEWKVEQTGDNLVAINPAVAGARQFFVRVPVDYDADRPYRIVYVGQGCGALRAGSANTYALFDEARGGTEQAVYVGVSVPDNDANPGCYDNNSGPESQEWEAFELMHTFVESHYCVDNNRIFIAGYSTGAWLANMYGCYFGGIPAPPRKFSPAWAIRGAAGVMGSLPPNQPTPCNGPAAHLWIHDEYDKSALIQTSVAALELALQTNGCAGNYVDGPKRPWAPAEQIRDLAGGVCQEYTGCPADVAKSYPLVFCTTSGLGRGDQPANAIPAFTRFFELMDPTPTP